MTDMEFRERVLALIERMAVSSGHPSVYQDKTLRMLRELQALHEADKQKIKDSTG